MGLPVFSNSPEKGVGLVYFTGPTMGYLIGFLTACYLASFLRLFINNNFIVSIIGSLLFGFVIAKRFSYSKEQILLSGFFSCFTSYSGFIYFLYKIFEQGNIIESIRSRKHCLNHPEIHRYLVLKYSLPSGFARMSTATTPNPKSGTGIDSTLRLAKIYKRLNLTYIGLLLTAEELADTIGPGFELEE